MVKFKGECNAQMMVLEAVIFSIMIISALLFIYQLSPPPNIFSSRYQNQLRILGDDALKTTDEIFNLATYIANNDTDNCTTVLNSMFPDYVGYNIYISNLNNTILWYNAEELWGGKIGMVSKSHCLLVIPNKYVNDTEYPNHEIIEGYKGCEYDIILEMWSI